MTYDYDRSTLHLGRGIPVDKPAIRELARDVEELVARKLSDKRGLIGQMKFGQLPFELRAVDGSRLEVWVLVRAVPSKSVRYFVGGASGTRRGHEPVVVVDVNGSLEAEVVWKATNAKTTDWQIFQILLHELTHAADIYERGLGMSESEARDNAAYYNNPSEVRAYMQEVVDEIEQRAHFYPKLKARFGQRALGMLLNMSPTWTEVSPRWTPANQQKVLKAVYQMLETSGAA